MFRAFPPKNLGRRKKFSVKQLAVPAPRKRLVAGQSPRPKKNGVPFTSEIVSHDREKLAIPPEALPRPNLLVRLQNRRLD